jgi:dolichol-phosphate mannosyltransferase
MVNLLSPDLLAKIPEPLATLEAAPGLRLALIVPTLREAGNIRALLQRVRDTLDPLHIQYSLMVVDDDSRDGIEAIVSEIGLEDPRVSILVREGCVGLAGAVIHGWQHTDAEVLGVIDADLQHPPELLAPLWQKVADGADLAVGSRYAAGGSLGEWNASRRFVSKVATWLTRPLQRRCARAHDPMSGFFLVRRSCIDGIGLQNSGFKILLEILARGRIRNLAEVQFDFGTRQAGASKASLRVAIEYALLLLRLYRFRSKTIWMDRKQYRPN